MKKPLLFLSALPILAIAGYLVWQNLPEKRFAKHLTRARLYAKENNLTAARSEYEQAFTARGKFTPYASLEVLNLTNRMNIQDKNPAEALANTRLFVQNNPANKEGQVILAELAFQLGETEAAFDAINGVLEKDPWYFPARLVLTNVRVKQGRMDLAEEQLRYLYAKFPDSVQSLLPLAEVLLKEGRSAESRGFLGKILARNPKNTRARLLLVDSYLKERKLDSAQLMLDAWKESDPDQKQALEIRKARLYSIGNKLAEAKAVLEPYRLPSESNLGALAELAIVHTKNGDYDSAIAVYKSMGEVAPSARLNAETMIFFLDMKNQNPAKALEAIKTIQITDKRNNLMTPLVAAYLAIGQDNKARDYIEQQPDSLKKPLNEFMAQAPMDKEFLGQWALITYYGANHQDYWVFKAVEEFYRRWPRNIMATEMWVAQLSSVGNAAEAAKVLATIEKPTLTHKVALVQLYSGSGQPEKAVALAEKLTQEYPNLQGLYVMLADYWIKKDKAKALRYYDKELALNPGNTVVLNNLAWEYGVNQNNLAKAQPYLDKLKTARNLDPRILDTMGWILAMNGKYAEGETPIRNALDLVPDFPVFQYHLAFILMHTGKQEEARKYLDLALASKLPFDERKDAEKLLGNPG